MGKEVVTWMVQNGHASNLKEAVQLGKDMDAAGRISYLGKDLGLNLPFDGGILFYKWTTPKESQSGDSFGSLKHVVFPLNSAQCCQVCVGVGFAFCFLCWSTRLSSSAIF